CRRSAGDRWSRTSWSTRRNEGRWTSCGPPGLKGLLRSLDQLELLDLSAGTGRQVVGAGEEDPDGNLEAGDVLGAVPEELVLVELRAGVGDDPGDPDLAHPLVGDRNDVGLRDARVAGKDIFDMLGDDEFPAAAVALLLPAGEREEALFVDPAEVAGPEPSGGVKGGRGLIRTLVVPGCDDRPFHDEFADRSSWKVLTRSRVDGLVHGEHAAELGIPGHPRRLEAAARRGQALHRVAGKDAGRRGGRLGHAVGREDLLRAEQVADLVPDPGGRLAPRREHDGQRR